jgi:uncharacterized membrane protein YoaK (UPF0700 family)
MRMTGPATGHAPAWALPVVLSIIAGSTDTIGFLGLNGLFTAHITGNLAILAAHVVARNPAILSYLLSVPVFMLVLFVTRLAAGGLERTGFATLAPLLLLQLLLLGGFLAVGAGAGASTDPSAPSAVVAGMLGVAAMAVQNALVQISLTSSPSTAVMTTNVTHFMLDLGAALVAPAPTEATAARGRAMRTLPVIVGFSVGCALGAAGEAAAGLASLALPVALALLALAMGVAAGCRLVNNSR